jgi:putative ABC transport system permease protein
MFTLFFKLALRNLGRNRLYTALNLGGLALGLATTILMLVWVQDELSYNTFHRRAGQLYRVNPLITQDGSQRGFATSPAAISAYGLREVPALKAALRITNNYDFNLFGPEGQPAPTRDFAYVEGNFFQLLDFELLQGDPNRPFPTKQSVILTEDLARAYFGTTDVVGRVLLADKDPKKPFTVSGVVANFPKNSTYRYQALFNYEWLKATFTGNGDWKIKDDDWGNFDAHTLVQVDEAAAVPEVERQLTQLILTHNQYAKGASFKLQPLTDIHLYQPNGEPSVIQLVRIFGLIAVAVLFIACINYSNLTTALATRRAKEVSLRKVNGAGRAQLFGQFMAEAAVVFLLALGLAWLLLVLARPVYQEISGKDLPISLLNPLVIKAIGAALLGTLLLAGVYPALLLSKFQPVLALKGQGPAGGGAGLRKVLVSTQFALSVVLVVGTLVVGRQLRYIQAKDLGYDRENMLRFALNGELREKCETITNELLANSAVLSVGSSEAPVNHNQNSTGDPDWEGRQPDKMVQMNYSGVDKNFFANFGIDLLAGQNFTGTAADTAKIIINEAALAAMGIADPVGKRFNVFGVKCTILGVVKDYHFAPLRAKIAPMFYYANKQNYHLYVKLKGGDAQAVIAQVQAWQKRVSPEFALEYEFLDQTYQAMYANETRLGQLLNYFAGVAIFLACLGLFGLATYAAEQRVKEIGIRKVLGASVWQVARLLATDFVRLVALAFVVAVPLAYYLMDRWLADYAYRVTLDGWLFALVGVGVLAVAVLTVSGQATRAALANPVKSLRSE